MTVRLDISDHSILRWLERRHGIDIDKVRAEIHAAAFPAASLGATKISTQGVTIVIATRTDGSKIVASVLPLGGQEGMAIANGYQRGKANMTRSELGRIKRRDRQRNNRTPA